MKFEPDEVYIIDCKICHEPKRLFEIRYGNVCIDCSFICDTCNNVVMETKRQQSSTINICIDCAEREQEEWDEMLALTRRISN